MTTSQDNLVLSHRDGGLMWLTLNRADKANAMTVGMVERLTAQLVAAGTDPSVQAVLLSGAGERVFCAGVDVREQPADGDMARQRERRSHGLAALQDAVLDTPKPVLVVLNGMASGAGAMLALLADVCVAVDTAEVALSEIDIGIATFSGASIVETVCGLARARDLVQSGRRMPATEAHDIGLVRALAPRAELAVAATGLATLLGSKKASVFADNKRWINRRVKAALAEARQEHAHHRAQAAAQPATPA
jgi:enoyl-CoA hydratase/carnithine racemase